MKGTYQLRHLRYTKKHLRIYHSAMFTTITVVCQEKEVTLSLPENNKISKAMLTGNSNGPIMIELSLVELLALKVYYEAGIVGNFGLLKKAMNFFEVEKQFDWDLPEDYIPIKLRELWIGYAGFKQPLTQLTQEVLDQAPLSNIDKSSCITSLNVDRYQWYRYNVEETLKTFSNNLFMKNVFNLSAMMGKDAGVVLAGGSIGSTLTRTVVADYDFFFYGVTDSVAKRFIKTIGNSTDVSRIERSAYAVTIHYHNQKYQFILRLYKSIAEILLSFDIDACRMAYDGKRILTTESCLFALKNKINVVNFDRVSVSYEYRLSKYARRGFSIFVPRFSYKNVLMHKIPEVNVDRKSETFTRLTGLSKIIYNCMMPKMITDDYTSNYDQGKSHTLVYPEVSDPELGDSFHRYTLNEPNFSGRYVLATEKEIVFVGTKAKMENWKPLPIENCKLNKEFIQAMEQRLNRKSSVPYSIEFITQNPGQQNTAFNPVSYETISQWYNGFLYQE